MPPLRLSVKSICGQVLISRSRTIANCCGTWRSLPRIQRLRVISSNLSAPESVNSIDTIGRPDAPGLVSKSARVPELEVLAGHLRDLRRVVVEEVVVGAVGSEGTFLSTRASACALATSDDDHSSGTAKISRPARSSPPDLRNASSSEAYGPRRPASSSDSRCSTRRRRPSPAPAPARGDRRARCSRDGSPRMVIDGPVSESWRSKSSSCAVVPMISAAASGSWTPGSWITIWSSPCVRISGPRHRACRRGCA